MILFLSIIALLLFIFLNSDSQSGNKSILRILINFVKVIFLVAIIILTVFNGFKYFKPLILSEKDEISQLNETIYFNNTFQEIQFHNDSEKENYYYFLLKSKNKKWHISKPVNKFDITYKIKFSPTSIQNLFFEADTGKYKSLCLYNVSDTIISKTNYFNVPVNSIVYFTTEEGFSEIPLNISYFHNIENLIFIIISIYIFFKTIMKNFPIQGAWRILFLILLIFLIAISGILGYREIMFFWDFYIKELITEIFNF